MKEEEKVNLADLSDEQLIDIRNKLEMEYGGYLDDCAAEVAELKTKQKVDLFSYFGEKKMNKIIKKYDTTKSLCVFFDCDDSNDDELIEVMEDDIHDCLNKLRYYKKNSVPIYRSSLSRAVKGKEKDCLQRMDNYIRSKAKKR